VENKINNGVDFDRIEVGVLGNCRTEMTAIDELADDIRERGLLQPLVVQHKHLKSAPHTLPDGRKVWDRYILIAGNRRYAAIAKIRKEDPGSFSRIPVTLFVGNDDDALFAQLSENLCREDMSIADTANALYAMSKRGHSAAEIARRISKGIGYVTRMLSLRSNASAELLQAVSEGKVPQAIATPWLELPEAEQSKALESYQTVAKQGPQARRQASKDARKAAGEKIRPTAKQIKERQAALLSKGSAQARYAVEVLSWVLGEGEWPEEKQSTS